MFTMRDCNCKDQLRNNCCCRPEGKSNKQCVCVTESDVLRWNAAAVAIAEIKDIVIDLDDYITRDEAQTIVEEYVDSQGFLKSIPEYYETEEEVLLLLKDYAKSSDIIKEDRIAQILTDYATLAYVTRFALNTDVQTITNPLVSTISFDTNSSTLTVTKRDGTTQGIYLQTASNGQGVPAGNQTMELIVYCNTLDTQTPATPVGGNYDFQNNIITLPTDPDNTYIWSTSTNGMTVDDTHRIWVSRRRFNTTATSDVNWSNPVVYSSGKTINTNITNNYVYDIAAIVTQYHKGQIERVAELDNNNVETGHYYRTIPPAKPVGGSYDVQTRTLTQHPHAPSDPTDLWQDAVTSQQWTDPDDPETTIEYTWFFTIGKVVDNNGTVTIEWQDPAVYGADYCLTAYNMRFIAVNYEVLADNVDISSETFQANIADRLSVDADFVDVVAQEIHIDSALTQFRGAVDATSFSVIEPTSNGTHHLDYYWELTQEGGINTVVKKYLDNKLMSISRNKPSGAQNTYDPYLDDSDPVLLVYKKGTVQNYDEGTPENGGGAGQVVGNDVEYVVSPKRLYQNLKTNFSIGYPYNHRTNNTLDANCYNMESLWWRIAAGNSDALNTFEDGSFELPDPKKYAGCTIKVDINCSTMTSCTFDNDNIDELWCAASTIVAHEYPYLQSGGTTDVLHYYGGYWTSDSQSQATKQNIAHDIALYKYTADGDNLYYMQSDYRASDFTSLQYKKIVSVLPHITINQDSVWQLVQFDRPTTSNAYNTTTAGLISLNMELYENLRDIYHEVNTTQTWSGDYAEIPNIMRMLTVDPLVNAAAYNPGQPTSWEEILDIFVNSMFNDVDHSQLESQVMILPSYSGIQKLASGQPLTFTATACNFHKKYAFEDHTAQGGLGGEFYPGDVWYWKLDTTDFIPVLVQAGKTTVTINSTPYDVTDCQCSIPFNTSNSLLNNSQLTTYSMYQLTGVSGDYVTEATRGLSSAIQNKDALAGLLGTLAFLYDTTATTFISSNITRDDQIMKMAKQCTSSRKA